LAGSSRFAVRRLRWPDTSEDAQVRALIDLADNHGLNGWVVFPTSDRTASLVSRNHQELRSRYRLTTSPWPSYSLAQDKRQAYERAELLGIAIPRTWLPGSAAEVEALDLPFPVILKPACGVSVNPFTRAKAWRVDDRDSLRARYLEARRFLPAELVMIQELISGGGACHLSFASVCRDGEVLASVTARRTRQIPADFGRLSTFVETIHRPDVMEVATKIILELGLTGLVEVEFKQDPRDRQLKLLDINARVWGWHSVGATAGVDFSYLAWRVAQDLDVSYAEARPGVRWVRLSTDVPVSLSEMIGGRITMPEYLRTLRRPVVGAIAASDDLVPGVAEIPLMLWRSAHRAFHRVGRDK
jgi:D-aspartate ligase